MIECIEEIMTLDDEVLEIAKRIYKENSLLVMGRGYNFATCLEGALKIKVFSIFYTIFFRNFPICIVRAF